MKKIFLICLITLLSLGNIGAQALTSQTTIKSTKKLSKYITNYDQKYIVYKTNDNNTVYSLDADKQSLKKKTTISFYGNADSGLLYILEKSYPNKKITGNSKIDQYITQSAIWLYLDKTKQGTPVNELNLENNKKDTYGLIKNYIKPLVKEALNAKNNNYKTTMPSINVNIDNTVLTLSKNKKYYESDYITVSLATADKYEVIAKNIIVMDENGNEKTTFNFKEKFKIKVPKNNKNKKISVTVKATGIQNMARMYKTSDNKLQKVIGLFQEKHSLNQTINFTIPLKQTCKFIDGIYHDKAGKETDKDTYMKECNNICKVIDNTYYDKNGKKTNEKTYTKECKNSCSFDGNTYYGLDNRKVDEYTYKQECGHEINVPSTNSNISSTTIISSILLIISGSILLYKKQKIN